MSVFRKERKAWIVNNFCSKLWREKKKRRMRLYVVLESRGPRTAPHAHGYFITKLPGVAERDTSSWQISPPGLRLSVQPVAPRNGGTTPELRTPRRPSESGDVAVFPYLSVHISDLSPPSSSLPQSCDSLCQLAEAVWDKINPDKWKAAREQKAPQNAGVFTL